MVDALDSKSSVFGRVGSIPTQGTKNPDNFMIVGVLFFILKMKVLGNYFVGVLFIQLFLVDQQYNANKFKWSRNLGKHLVFYFLIYFCKLNSQVGTILKVNVVALVKSPIK